MLTIFSFCILGDSIESSVPVGANKVFSRSPRLEPLSTHASGRKHASRYFVSVGELSCIPAMKNARPANQHNSMTPTAAPWESPSTKRKPAGQNPSCPHCDPAQGPPPRCRASDRLSCIHTMQNVWPANHHNSMAPTAAPWESPSTKRHDASASSRPESIMSPLRPSTMPSAQLSSVR